MDFVLGKDEEREVARFRRALELQSGFAFHVLVADTKLVLDTAVERLAIASHIIRPRPLREMLVSEAATEILSEIDHALTENPNETILIDAMTAEWENAWIFVFRRLNELRNGIEKRHAGPLLLALTPKGETVLGQQAPDLWSKRGSGMRLRDRRTPQAEEALPTDSINLIKPPETERAFVSLCFEFFKNLWNDPGAQRDARSAQPASGIDIFGRVKGKWIGVHCRFAPSLSPRELEISVEKAKTFEPRLDTLIVATTGTKVAMIEEHARKLARVEGLEVQIWPWTAIVRDLAERPAIFASLLSKFSISSERPSALGKSIAEGALVGFMVGGPIGALVGAKLGTIAHELGSFSKGNDSISLLPISVEARLSDLTGNPNKARELFLKAEAEKRRLSPAYPLLQSFQGFWYCDFLLNPAELAAAKSGRDARATREECREVERRAARTLEWAVLDRAPLLDLAIDHLTLGRALLYGDILDGKESASSVTKEEIDTALDLLRAAGPSEFLPLGLLTRAWFRHFEGDLNGARADLDDAQALAETGPLPLIQADVALYRARLFHDRAGLSEARRLADEQGYGRRSSELFELEAESATW